MKNQKTKPIAVLISDVHYNLQTLEVADKAVRMALAHAGSLNAPLIIAGDLHDTKANMRAECFIALSNTFDLREVPIYILRGNHDSVNERSAETPLSIFQTEAMSDERSGFDQQPIAVVTKPGFYNDLGGVNGHSIHLIPYHSNPDELRVYLKKVDKGSLVIMHQGILGSEAGHYIQDSSALAKPDLAGLTVVSGHYHRRQTLELPDGGRFDYLGSPYTTSFGEAEDPPKGFQVLYNDGSLEFVPTNLRAHKIINLTYGEYDGAAHNIPAVKPDDIFWVKVKGPAVNLAKLTKSHIKSALCLPGDFRLDLIPDEVKTEAIAKAEKLTRPELLDSLVDSLSNTSQDKKADLKKLWREFT